MIAKALCKEWSLAYAAYARESVQRYLAPFSTHSMSTSKTITTAHRIMSASFLYRKLAAIEHQRLHLQYVQPCCLHLKLLPQSLATPNSTEAIPDIWSRSYTDIGRRFIPGPPFLFGAMLVFLAIVCNILLPIGGASRFVPGHGRTPSLCRKSITHNRLRRAYNSYCSRRIFLRLVT